MRRMNSTVQGPMKSNSKASNQEFHQAGKTGCRIQEAGSVAPLAHGARGATASGRKASGCPFARRRRPNGDSRYGMRRPEAQGPGGMYAESARGAGELANCRKGIVYK
ncbi:MAG: hypothetical protein H6566_18575 [Lewinellaceae bacterium]|nr:hypothetical protein [Lewinellaceae bacterium]